MSLTIPPLPGRLDKWFASDFNFHHLYPLYIRELDFREYDHFYFFNSFYENLPGTCKIDNNLTYSSYLYNSYNRYLYDQLEKMPTGTRLATYHCSEEEAPNGYHLVGTAIDHLLSFWVKG